MSQNAAAMALDAADGKIDGKFFGNQITQSGNTASARVTTQQPVAITRAVVPYTGAAAVNTMNTGVIGLQQFGAQQAGFQGFANYAPAFNTGFVAAGSPFVAGGYAGRSLATLGTQAVIPTGNVMAVNTVPQVAAVPQVATVNTGFVNAAPTVVANTIPNYGASYYGAGYTGLGGVGYSGLYGAGYGAGIGAGYGVVNQGVAGVAGGQWGTTGGAQWATTGGGQWGATGATVLRGGVNQVYGTGLYGANVANVGGLYGANVVNTVAAPTTVGVVGGGGLVGGYGYGAVQPTFIGGSNAASRLALDAADGRIDGSFFGAPIV